MSRGLELWAGVRERGAGAAVAEGVDEACVGRVIVATRGTIVGAAEAGDKAGVELVIPEMGRSGAPSARSSEVSISSSSCSLEIGYFGQAYFRNMLTVQGPFPHP